MTGIHIVPVINDAVTKETFPETHSCGAMEFIAEVGQTQINGASFALPLWTATFGSDVVFERTKFSSPSDESVDARVRDSSGRYQIASRTSITFSTPTFNDRIDLYLQAPRVVITGAATGKNRDFEICGCLDPEEQVSECFTLPSLASSHLVLECPGAASTKVDFTRFGAHSLLESREEQSGADDGKVDKEGASSSTTGDVKKSEEYGFFAEAAVRLAFYGCVVLLCGTTGARGLEACKRPARAPPTSHFV